MVKTNSKLVAQAEQGSIAAIIQVLNQHLSASGVRVRAVLVRGVLQLLCEARDSEPLERHRLVQRIRQILESLHPRHIRRVCINSRIINEQQLLWLDEINRDPASQLLWSEEILLARPNLLMLWLRAWRASESDDVALPAINGKRRYAQQQYWRGLWGGAALGAGLLLVGGLLYSWLKIANPSNASIRSLSVADNATNAAPGTSADPASSEPPNSELSGVQPNEASLAPADANSTDADQASAGLINADSNNTDPDAAIASEDPFVTAVRLAEKSATEGKTANTADEWTTIADTWQQASDLMGQVDPADSRYSTAQDRYQLYQGYATQARSQAQQRQ